MKTFYILLSNNTDIRDSVVIKVKAKDKKQAKSQAFDYGYRSNKFYVKGVYAPNEVAQATGWSKSSAVDFTKSSYKKFATRKKAAKKATRKKSN